MPRSRGQVVVVVCLVGLGCWAPAASAGVATFSFGPVQDVANGTGTLINAVSCPIYGCGRGGSIYDLAAQLWGHETRAVTS